MWMQKPSFRFEIENSILSKTFVAGGCEWYLYVYPKGRFLDPDHFSFVPARCKSYHATNWVEKGC
uniref:MATH domain-containing protein n=1 Tax=Brassica oleracea TaxID=3712 RepID=A0A3P6D057_BRAOL|nr:unnamed protein product [Brassica oleracea]